MGVPIVIEHEQLTFNAACFSQFNFCVGNAFTHRGNSAFKKMDGTFKWWSVLAIGEEKKKGKIFSKSSIL